VPVAVVPFGWRHTARRLERLDCRWTLRMRADGSVFVTDDANYVLDCAFGPIADPARLASLIDATCGVVEHGIFLGVAQRVIVAARDGLQVLHV